MKNSSEKYCKCKAPYLVESTYLGKCKCGQNLWLDECVCGGAKINILPAGPDHEPADKEEMIGR